MSNTGKTVEELTRPEIRLMANQIAIGLAQVTDTTPGGIVLPTSAVEAPQYGIVIALGPHRKIGSKTIPFEVAVGDRILVSKYAGTQVKIDDNTYYLIVQENDILAVVE